MDEADLRTLSRLAAGQRAAALGTLVRGGPYVSLALYAPAPGLGEFYLHLSRLAIHARNLRADPRASLMIAEPDLGLADPQTLVRVSLQGAAVTLEKGSAEHKAARVHYLGKFPEAAPLFQLGDFDLYRFTPAEGRFIPAFGRILNLTPEHLRAAGAL